MTPFHTHTQIHNRILITIIHTYDSRFKGYRFSIFLKGYFDLLTVTLLIFRYWSLYDLKKITVTCLHFLVKMWIWLSLSCVPWFLETVYPFLSIWNVMCTLETRVHMTNLIRSGILIHFMTFSVIKDYVIE